MASPQASTVGNTLEHVDLREQDNEDGVKTESQQVVDSTLDETDVIPPETIVSTLDVDFKETPESTALVRTQPGLIPSPSIQPPLNEKSSMTVDSDLEAQTRKRYTGPRRNVPGIMKILVTIGTVLKIMFLYVIPGLIFIVIFAR